MQRVVDRIHRRPQSTHGAGLAHTLGAQRVHLGRHLPRRQPEVRVIGGARHLVVHEARGQHLAGFRVEDNHLAQRLANPLHHAAMDLPGNQHRIQHLAEFLHRTVAHDFGHAGVRIDFHLADMRAVGEGHGGGGEFAGFDQPAFLTGRDVLRIVCRAPDIGQGDRPVGAGDAEAAGFQLHIDHRRFQQFRGELAGGFDHLVGRRHHRVAADAQRARPAVALAAGQQVGVAGFVAHHVHRHTETVGDDLAEGGLQPLAHRHRPGPQGQGAVLGQAELGLVLGGTQEGAAGDLDAVAQPDAAQLAPCLGLGATRRKTVVLGEFGRQLHVALELPAIVQEGQRGLVGHRLGRDQVAAAQFVWGNRQFAGGDVDQALDDIGRFRPAGAAIGRGRHGVGHDAADPGGDGGNVIHAGDTADIADAPAGPPRGVRAQVGVPAHLQRGELAVRIQPEFGMDAHLARLFVGQEALGPVGDPAHRAVEPARRPGDQHDLDLHAGLHAEGAADIAGEDADIGRLDPEIAVRHAVAQVVGRLVGGVHLHPPVRPDLRPGAPRFHGVGGDAGDGEVQLRHMRRGGQVGLSFRLVAALPQEADIVGHVVPDRGRAGLHCGMRVGHDRQGRVVHNHRFRGLHGGAAGFRDDHRHGLTHEADPVAGQQLAVGLRRGATIGTRKADAAGDRLHVGQVGVGEHGDHTGHRARRGGVDRVDRRMRVRRAHQHGLQHALRLAIRGVVAAAGQQALVFPTADRPRLHCRHGAAPLGSSAEFATVPRAVASPAGLSFGMILPLPLREGVGGRGPR